MPWILATHTGHVTDHTHNSHRTPRHTHRCRMHTGVGTHVCRKPAQDGHVHTHTCAHPEFTQDIYACIHTHKVLTQVLQHARAPMLTPNVGTRVCACTQSLSRGYSLNKESPQGMLVSQLFSFPVKHPGLLQNVHSPLTLPSSGPPSFSLPGLLPFRLDQGTKDRP